MIADMENANPQLVGYIAGAITGSLVSLIGIVAKSILDSRSADRSERRRLYSEIVGLRSHIKQLEASRAEAIVQSNYHEVAHRLGLSDLELHKSEALAKQELSIKYAEMLATEKRNLHQVLASTSALFRDDKVDNAINRIYGLRHINVLDFRENIDTGSLVKEYREAVEAVPGRAGLIWDKPIDRLTRLLKEKL